MRSQPRVLIVDDSPTTCLFVASTLEQAGYNVEVAFKGQEGLAKVMKFQPSCLILDVILPDISGYAICRQMQQTMLRNPLYIIIISSKNTPLDQHYGLRQGANCYLPKPFTAEDLVRAVWEGVPEPLRHVVHPTLPVTPPKSAPPALSERLPHRVSNQGAMRTDSPFAHTSAMKAHSLDQLSENVPPALSNLLPRRMSSQSAMRANSPFAHNPTITDKQVEQFYRAIDGKRTLAELAAVTGLEARAVTRATHVLLKEHCIQIYDATGQLVEMPLEGKGSAL